MVRWRAPCAALATLLLVACGEPTLKSDDFEGSARRLRESVGQEDRVALDGALDLVRRASAGEVAGTDPFSVDGMTAADVRTVARRIELRREKASIEEEIAAHRKTLTEAERLAGLGLPGVTVVEERLLTLPVRNGLGEPLTDGWVRTSIELPDGRIYSSEDYVGFGRPLQPGEEREVRVQVTGGVGELLPVPPDWKVTAVFTMVANAGFPVAKEPTADEIARAEAAIQDAERKLVDVERRLREAG